MLLLLLLMRLLRLSRAWWLFHGRRSRWAHLLVGCVRSVGCPRIGTGCLGIVAFTCLIHHIGFGIVFLLCFTGQYGGYDIYQAVLILPSCSRWFWYAGVWKKGALLTLPILGGWAACPG